MPLTPAGQLSHSVLDLLKLRDGRPDETQQPLMTVPWPSGAANDALARRRAVRHFTDEPISLPALATVIEHARAAGQTVWPAEVHGLVEYTILIAAFRVTGLDPGLYLAGGDTKTDPFSRPTDAPWLDSLRAAYADAACLLLICANITAACRTGGPGYGPLLIRAGTIGYAAWLSAISLGLAGCVYARPHYRVTEVARLVDGRSNHVFTISLGTAPTHEPYCSDTTLGGGGQCGPCAARRAS
jgi:hypothetical protein